MTKEKFYEYSCDVYDISKRIDNGIVTPEEGQLEYCDLYIEKMATKKAIEILRNNYEEIKKFEKRLEKYLTKEELSDIV